MSHVGFLRGVAKKRRKRRAEPQKGRCRCFCLGFCYCWVMFQCFCFHCLAFLKCLLGHFLYTFCWLPANPREWSVLLLLPDYVVQQLKPGGSERRVATDLGPAGLFLVFIGSTKSFLLAIGRILEWPDPAERFSCFVWCFGV